MPLPEPSATGFTNKWKRQRHAVQIGGPFDHAERRGGHAAGTRGVPWCVLCAAPTRASAGPSTVYGMPRYSQIAGTWDSRLRPLFSLGQLKTDFGTGEGKFLGEERVGFEPDDAAEETKSLLHRGDGGCIVPLGVLIGTWARSRVSRCTRDRYACGLGIPPTKRPLSRAV